MFKIKLPKSFGGGRPASFGEILDESSFAQVLGVERKRTDRSGRPFLLVLLDLRLALTGEQGVDSPLIKKVIRSLKVCTRQTDLTGWYKAHCVVGVIFTEICGEENVVEVILEKIRDALRVHVKQKDAERIALRVHAYPDEDGSLPESGLDGELFPDLRKPTTRHLFKRMVDVFGSLALLIILGPFMLLVAAAIGLSSRGPILFHQTRIGRLGKPFTFLKFRSMRTGVSSRIHEEYVGKFIKTGEDQNAAAEIAQNGEFKIQRDPRVTPLGRLIRRTSIDELPQLFNVLLGDMSLVGPRPPVLYEVENYDKWHRRRLLEAKPGITGLWQVTGRSQTTFNEMVRLDLRYVDEWNLWTDLKILFRTPLAVLSCRGAS